nr:immunoglobulin heavy chain junction region [Macaca mulatta]MOV45374.1 immunoglobulin heavy chain junction region [Macaca mulatta]MOV47295.1 immunoglobulin heavy chain junction region [Macaca mulatta]
CAKDGNLDYLSYNRFDVW